MSRRFAIALAANASALSLCWTAAQAETAVAQGPPTAQSTLGEVVVTARKFTENLQNVPVAVSAFSSAELKSENIRTIYQLQLEVPSLLFKTAVDDPQSLTVTLRGREQNDVTLAVDPAVGLYVDGLYIPRTLGMAGSLVDLSQVEVLRGPQGTLYGRNTTGGAISITTNNPTDQFGGSLDVTGGTYNLWNVIGVLNVPITSWLDARFVAQRGMHDGYGHDLIGDPLESEDSQYYRVKLLAKLGDKVQAVLSAHYESNHSGGEIEKLVGIAPAGGGAPAGGVATLEYAAETGLPVDQAAALMQSYVDRSSTNFYDTSGNFRTYGKIKRWDVDLDITGQLPSGMSWRSITGMQELERFSLLGTPFPGDAIKVDLQTEDKYYSQEFQLLQQASNYNWVVGLYGGYERGDDNGIVFVLPALGVPSGTNNAGIRNRSLAVYGQGTWEFIPSWRVTLGARYSSDQRQADDVALNGNVCAIPAPGYGSLLNPGTPSQCPRNFSSTFREPTWLASLDHKFTQDVLVYAKVATGYRSGGQNTGGNTEIETFAPFLPEKNTEYEVGVKTQWFDERLRVNLAAYHDDYSNLQVTTNFIAADGQVATAVTNAASSRIQGVEADAKFAVTSRFTLNASAGYTDAHYIHFVDFTGDRSREAFPVPIWAGVVGGRYVQPTAIGDFAITLNYSWRTKTVLDAKAAALNEETQPAYGVLDGRIDLNIAAWDLDVALFGNNITGTKYYDNGTAHDTSLGVNFAFAGAPATFGIEVTKRFGGH